MRTFRTFLIKTFKIRTLKIRTFLVAPFLDQSSSRQYQVMFWTESVMQGSSSEWTMRIPTWTSSGISNWKKIGADGVTTAEYSRSKVTK